MADFFYRTEDIRSDEVQEYFVETQQDRSIIEHLKNRNPVVLVGSRGVGKSFLFRMAESELLEELPSKKILPVYITFRRSSLVQTKNNLQFHHWMLARLCHEIVRTLSKSGKLTNLPPSLAVLAGEPVNLDLTKKTRIELIAEEFEESWQDPGKNVNVDILPSIDIFLEAVEDICTTLDIKRIVLFFDEAAHIFWPEQQRQFFTLFRDLRSPFFTCNAAVYPGVTAFGDTFQPIHDATIVPLNRDVQDDKYLSNMREMVTKQVEESSLLKNIARNGENFSILAYAASGNPRHLLKTLTLAPKLDRESVNKVIREYYRTDIWSEHSGLAEKYPGHTALVDWGRKFIEQEVLPELQRKNERYLEEEKKTTSFFWLHRDAPQPVKESLRLLEYTGIVSEHASGIKATRSEIGKRYFVNLGCLMGLETTPTINSFKIAKEITPKRMNEYGANYPFFQSLLDEIPDFSEPDYAEVLNVQLENSMDNLDLTNWQKDRLRSLGLETIGDILRASETKLQEAQHVGEKRARRIRNIALAAVYEYLSG